MPTRVLAYWDEKRSRVEIDIDASNRVTAIRRVGGPATVVLARPDGSRSYTLDRTVTQLVIGTTTSTRVLLTFDAARDRYNGLAGEVRSES